MNSWWAARLHASWSNQILADTQAYHTLEENFKKMGFERADNGRGQKQS